MKKTILLIHTGGTISMAMSDEGAVMPNKENPLMKESSKLDALATIIEMEAFNLPSPHITQKEMLKLRNLIIEKVAEAKIDGVVITHGTDTLEETAYFLELTTDLSIPIVLTGAMRSSNELGADGVYNLVEAVRVAVDEEAREKGVLVAMNDEVHLAVNTTKTSTSSVNTFQSPQYGPIGLITKSRILFHHAPIRRQYVDIDGLSKRVAMLKVYAGMEVDLLDVVLACKYDGVVLEGLGQGNVPPSVVKGIESLIERGIPVILVSRCFNGIAEGVYGYDGGGKMLEDLGAIFATGINGQKARLKLLIGLNKVGAPIDLKDFFM
ncbi:asparaginase [Lysinibacillus sphaericus]|uniref:asparaginase n=1 Tax=Lysinibacillus sphaericus TaxID=1421 RepID=UPI0018CEF29A|nr:asparaginase [Lysinibacillus sphaericus]MBG9455322.1 asparaginase [Lysinibacillus sphaericus]MBG9476144.1 asparaginase [Lysinibacillus sphaericus]MBG9592583.1 asparaginase [Lysinibacillus sphaericus]